MTGIERAEQQHPCRHEQAVVTILEEYGISARRSSSSHEYYLLIEASELTSRALSATSLQAPGYNASRGENYFCKQRPTADVTHRFAWLSHIITISC